MKKIFAIMFLFIAFITPIKANETQESTLSINTTYETEVIPDTVKINFSLTDSGLSIKDIKAKNDKTISNVINLIKKELSANESIKTTNYNIRPIYNYKDKIKVFQKYEITNGFEVKLKDMNKISSIIKLATENGIKDVGNISFYIENKEKTSNDAIIEAIKLAKNRANVVSNASGTQILKIKSIDTTSSLDNAYSQRRYLYTNSAKMMDSASSDVGYIEQPIEIGTIKVNATANIVYYLK